MSHPPSNPGAEADDASLAQGAPVYASFDPSKHVHDGELTLRALGLLIVSIKPAPNPAVVIMEMNPVGRLNVYDAQCAPDMHARQFGQELVLPLLKQRHGESFHPRSFVLLVPFAPSPGDMSDAWSMQFSVAMEEYRGQIRPVDPEMQIQGLAAAERFITGSVELRSLRQELLRFTFHFRAEAPDMRKECAHADHSAFGRISLHRGQPRRASPGNVSPRQRCCRGISSRLPVCRAQRAGRANQRTFPASRHGERRRVGIGVVVSCMQILPSRRHPEPSGVPAPPRSGPGSPSGTARESARTSSAPRPHERPDPEPGENRPCPLVRHQLMRDLISGSHLALVPSNGRLPTQEHPDHASRTLYQWQKQQSPTTFWRF